MLRRIGNGGLAGASGGDGTTTEASLSGRLDENGVFDTYLLGIRVEAVSISTVHLEEMERKRELYPWPSLMAFV